jgi:hypothetical protein
LDRVRYFSKIFTRKIYDSESLVSNSGGVGFSPVIKNFSDLLKWKTTYKNDNLNKFSNILLESDESIIQENISNKLTEEMSSYISDIQNISIYLSPSCEQLLWTLTGKYYKDELKISTNFEELPYIVQPPQLLVHELLPLPLTFQDLREFVHYQPYKCLECNSHPPHIGVCIVCGKILCVSRFFFI